MHRRRFENVHLKLQGHRRQQNLNQKTCKKLHRLTGQCIQGSESFLQVTRTYWKIFQFFLKTHFFSHFWPSNEFLVFIKSKPLMSRSFWVYLQPSRCFLWEVVVVWSSDARNSWKFPILQISQNMTKLAILATLTNFILPTSFFELYHSNFGGSITTIICAYRSFQTSIFFTFGALSHRQNITGPEDPPNSYRRSNTPTVIGLTGLQSYKDEPTTVTQISPNYID